MDRIDAMRLFVRIVERRSFTLAAQDIGVPRSTVTQVIKGLEERLGVRLLQRTTRVVSPTLDGEAYARRCVAILADIENAEGAFSGAKPRGVLRVEVQGTIARHFLLPGLPDFLAEYPDIEIVISEGERWVDIVREGVDCVLRYGQLADSEMIARRVTMIERMTCAAPAYLERHGVPRGLDDLAGHRMIGLRSFTTGLVAPLEFAVGDSYRSMTLPTPVSVTGTESYLAAALLGFGLFQVPRFHAEAALARGDLIQLLPDNPPPSVPVSLLYPPSRQLSPRVRVFMDWATRRFE
jgi:DNA-binding transcriptional LysR family regulator